MVFQDSYASLNPRLTIAETLAFAPKAHGLPAVRGARTRARPAGQGRARARHLRGALSARAVGRPAPAGEHRPRAGASGRGWSILDEAVSALDKSVEAQVLNMLVDLKSELGLTYVFISHDLNVVQYLSDRVLVMYLGKIVEIGNGRGDLRQPAAPLYAGAAVGAADDGSAQAHQGGADPGRSAQPDRSAVGLPLPHPLPVRRGCLRAGRAAADEAGAQEVACHMRVARLGPYRRRHDMSESSAGQGPPRHLRDARPHRACGERRQLRRQARRDAGHPGRIGLGQERHPALDPEAPSRAPHALVGQHQARGRRDPRHDRQRARRPARQSRRHDLPGAGDGLRSGLHHRPSDRRDGAPPHRQERGRRHEARPRAPGDGAHPLAGAAAEGLSARDVGRHAPARHDRAGAVAAIPASCWPTSRPPRSTRPSRSRCCF